jgi:diguanylate cyclase (GGDEF)-like protein
MEMGTISQVSPRLLPRSPFATEIYPGDYVQLVHESILTELKASGKLPTPAGVALTILELTRNPDSSTEDITLVLKGDPSLSGQILKYANSASSGCREEVTNVNDALVRLGMKMVRQLCLGFSILSTSRTGQCQQFDYPGYWTKSLARGVSGQVLSSVIRAVNAEEGFTCGLLNSIGALGLASVYPREYSRVLENWQEGSRTELTELEKEELSISRHQVTSALFEDWGLPEYFREAALLQDQEQWQPVPDDPKTLSKSQLLARLLYVSDLASRICLSSGLEQDRLVLDYLGIGRSLNIPEHSWIEKFDMISSEWVRMGQILNVDTGRTPSLETLKHRAEQSNETGLLQIDSNEAETNKPRQAKTNSFDTVPELDTGVNSIMDNAGGEQEAACGLAILVATESPVEQKILMTKLSKAGHRPTLAVNGQQALEMALQTSPQVILANWSLPEIEGLELCHMLRQSEQTARTYFIVMTSQDGKDPLVEAFEAGIDDYLVKPLSHDVLTARLKGASRIIHLQEQSEIARDELRQNLTKVSKMSRQLERMALEDQLTALPNRRAGLSRFDQEWSRANRNDSTLLCMILDIDHFKKVNDNYGHDCGDVVLSETAKAMKSAIRDTDTICRFGGEEFLVICPEADLDMAMEIGDRIRRAVQDNHITCPGYDGSVTISIGVALRTGEQDSPKDLIKEADQALYAAKENGRNKVCIYSD